MTYVLRRIDQLGIYRYHSNVIDNTYSLSVAKKYVMLISAKLDLSYKEEGWEIVDFNKALEDGSLSDGHRYKLNQIGNRLHELRD